ncbi:hypothetical protein OKW21_006692 [Catalinimonas alkaloidigena]|uniref:IS4 family transposase n=1 Tax=Catalinimonas alkaloidigena TaxID=1075417 RepID=UPI002404DB2D|nr:IS4 family transposase [Catalinimonas alkaloidigena]MDF9795088.1 hypothetical protein [Catalinimonas alkaloidigena]MDF9796310.1 hypothetical protein [Catalinimonas alkaloidigena]MDF9798044.1 hypothetical protein [Catalinimonas alkaloidigena]MDF9800150.1 hypothetical protein [Catalinimonas alkaloidigena]MDF9801383.1 hypothetical protein [Catalinimonas alkaloidigena]
MRTVQFCELATELNDEVRETSNERRIQAFFKDALLDYQQVAALLSRFLPPGEVSLSLDRTEWDFGQCQVNILCITACVGKVGLPLYFEMLDNKSGNSNYQDRIDLLKQCVRLLGKARIASVIMDREFIGHQWLTWLQKAEIPFCVRVPKHHTITLRNGETYQAEELMAHQSTRYFQNAIVDGVRVNVAIRRLANREMLYVIGTHFAKQLPHIYRKRWTIEVFFQSLKGRGFKLEGSHLRSLDKWKKLFALVCIAFAICLSLGREFLDKTQKVAIKKHGYPAKSTFRRGLDWFRQYLKGKHQADFDRLLKLFLRRVERTGACDYQLINIIG